LKKAVKITQLRCLVPRIIFAQVSSGIQIQSVTTVSHSK